MTFLRKAFIAVGLTLVLAGTARADFLYSFMFATYMDFKFMAPSLLNVTTTIEHADLFDVVNHTNPLANLTLDRVQIGNPYSTAPYVRLIFAGGQIGSYTANDWPGPFDHVGTYNYFTGTDRLTISEIAPAPVPEPSSFMLVLTALGGLWLVGSRVRT